MNTINEIELAQAYIQQGKILAYPTEAVYGLGCDPFNRQAVETLVQLKQRSLEKGLILLIADWPQLWPLIEREQIVSWSAIKKTWPGPVTWLFPKSDGVPEWISGHYNTIAIRMTAHPVARALCSKGPIVSTSANISTYPAARTLHELEQQFATGIDAVVGGALGEEHRPSAIYDVLSGQCLR